MHGRNPKADVPNEFEFRWRLLLNAVDAVSSLLAQTQCKIACLFATIAIDKQYTRNLEIAASDNFARRHPLAA